jgi:hypothetical protein
VETGGDFDETNDDRPGDGGDGDGDGDMSPAPVLHVDDAAPVTIEVRPGSIYGAYMDVATSHRGGDLSPAEVVVAALAPDLGVPGGRRWPAGWAAALCARAAVHLGPEDPFVGLARATTELVALYESGEGAPHLADPAARAMLGREWARVVGEMAGREQPRLGACSMSDAARRAIEMVRVETDELFSRLAACYDRRLAPRSLAEAAMVGARAIEDSGTGLGATSIAGCCLVGMGAAVTDLPATERGEVFDPVRYHEDLRAHEGETPVDLFFGSEVEAEATYLHSWREIQLASNTEDVLLNRDYAGERAPFAVRQMIRPLLDAVPGDMDHLAYLIGCAPLLGWFAAVPASYVRRLSPLEHYGLLRARQIERDAPALERRRELELLRDGLSLAEVAPGRVTFGAHDELAIAALLDWVVDILVKQGIELGAHGAAYLSTQIAVVADWAVGKQLDWRETGEIVGPASLCICGPGAESACRCDPATIVEEQVELVYDALEWEIIGPFAALVTHQGPPPSPHGWPAVGPDAGGSAAPPTTS